jgi:hypothetical protein|tara:strand:- start:1603 stop:2502 length:900 start_codon:yes stop_codon:yes gene_type:complete
MFKMGGSTTPRENFADKGYTDYMKSAQEKYAKQQEALKKMGGLQTLQTAARLSPFLQQDTNNPFKFLSNIVSDPALLQEVILPGMSEKKKAELLANDPKTDLAFAKAMKPDKSGFSTRLKSEAAVQRIQNEINQKRMQLQGATPEQQDILKRQIGDLRQRMRVFISGDTVRDQAIQNIIAQGKIDQETPDLSNENIDAMIKTIQGYASGGRVDRQMGTPMMGEQPMQQETQMSEQPMQPEGQQDPYQYLRTRLPAEIPDQVVKLIAYNQEAFNDFAAIETQDDLDSFNKRYNVELVVNV